LIDDLYQLWDTHYVGYNVNHIDGDKKEAIKLFESKDSAVDFDTKSLLYDLKMAEADVIAKDWGLNWSANYLYNTAPGMDLADNIIFRSRVQSDLRWSILNNGYIENKTKSEIKQNEALIALLEQKNIGKKAMLFDTWHQIIYQFNIHKLMVLNQRLELSKSRVETAHQLYAQGMISQEEMLKNVESYAEIKSLYKIYQDYNNQLQKTAANQEIMKLPLIDIDYTYTINTLSKSSNDSLNALLMKNFDLDHKQINDINLSVFSRYNYYDLASSSISDRSFFTLGINLGVPLVFDKKEQDKYRQLKVEQLKYEVPEQEIQEKNDVLGYFYEFRYKLKQFNNFYYKALLYKELLRKEQARHKVDPLSFNPLKSLRILDDLMSIDIELIDLKQQMYLYALRIYAAVPDATINELIQPITLEDPEIKTQNIWADEIYIWSKTIKEEGSKFVAEYCVKKGFKKAIISVGGDKNLLIETIEELGKKQIEVDLMVGNNNLIDKDVKQYLDEKLWGIKETNFKGIHLDVEPNVNSDWHENKAIYLTKYKAMIFEAEKYCKSNKLILNISIPLHYPEEFVQDLFQNVESIYFMAYENVKTDYIVRKIENYDASKIIIALRTEDFESVSDMNMKIEEISSKVKVKGFVIHDLGRLIQFEK
jgi:hypothetical protein